MIISFPTARLHYETALKNSFKDYEEAMRESTDHPSAEAYARLKVAEKNFETSKKAYQDFIGEGNGDN